MLLPISLSIIVIVISVLVLPRVSIATILFLSFGVKTVWIVPMFRTQNISTNVYGRLNHIILSIAQTVKTAKSVIFSKIVVDVRIVLVPATSEMRSLCLITNNSLNLNIRKVSLEHFSTFQMLNRFVQIFFIFVNNFQRSILRVLIMKMFQEIFFFPMPMLPLVLNVVRAKKSDTHTGRSMDVIV